MTLSHMMIAVFTELARSRIPSTRSLTPSPRPNSPTLPRPCGRLRGGDPGEPPIPLSSPLRSPVLRDPVVLPFPPHPCLPPGVENVTSLGNSGNLPIVASLRHLRDPIFLWFRSQQNPPLALISDFFLGWTFHLCTQIGIPRFAFFSSGAFLASILHFCFHNIDLIRPTHPIRFSDLPGTPVFEEEHVPSVVRRSLRTPSPDQG